jgi:hypothetical protein
MKAPPKRDEHIFEQVCAACDQVITEAGDEDVSPAYVATRVVELFRNKANVDFRLLWMAIEQGKQIARQRLRDKFDPVRGTDENEAYQEDMFSGLLQGRYPLPHQRDQEPIYRLRQRLTKQEAMYNVERLRKSADSRMQHARALEAYAQELPD